jgi:hypothetical protein
VRQAEAARTLPVAALRHGTQVDLALLARQVREDIVDAAVADQRVEDDERLEDDLQCARRQASAIKPGDSTPAATERQAPSADAPRQCA